MELIECPACAKDVSQQTISCPGCGHAFKSADNNLLRYRYKRLRKTRIFMYAISALGLLWFLFGYNDLSRYFVLSLSFIGVVVITKKFNAFVKKYGDF